MSNIKAFIGTTIAKMFRKEVFLLFEKRVFDVNFDATDDSTNGSDIVYRVVNRNEFDKFSDNLKKYGYSSGQADFFVAAIINEELVHWEFVSCNDEISVMELERSFHIPSHSAYVYAGYTVPNYRGRGIAVKVLEKACNYLKERKIQEAYALIRDNNLAIKRVLQKLGARDIGRITFIKLFGKKFYHFKCETNDDRQRMIQMFS